jgi:hypothetical protein
MITDVILDQKRVNVCKLTVKMVPCESFGKVSPEEWMGDCSWKSGGVAGS